MRSLRRRINDLTVVGLVYDVMESGIYKDNCADLVYQLPFPTKGAEALLERLQYIHASTGFDILIPTLDAELPGMMRIEQSLAELSVRMMLPTETAFHACRKQELHKLAKKCGCPTPVTLSAVETKGLRAAAAAIGYPVMIKGPYYGAERISTEVELIREFDMIIQQWGGPVLLQECVAGSEFDVIAVGDGVGGVGGYCTIRKTVISDKGKGLAGFTIRDEKLDVVSLRLIEKLQWRGPIELEFIKSDDADEYVLIEVNPRFPAWVDFPSAIGHNLPALVVDSLLDGSMPTLPQCEVGKFFVRHSVDLVGDLSQLQQLSTLGELASTEITRPAASGERVTQGTKRNEYTHAFQDVRSAGH